MKSLKAFSPAKINLTLDVFSKLKNSDFHPIQTILHKIDLGDAMEIWENKTFEIEGEFSCPIKKNLIYQAFKLVQKYYSNALPVNVKIKKNIPEKGGLGGGSSNFASFIKLYFQYFNLGTIPQEIIEESAQYGKDIPFFFCEKSCALGGNFGEKITPLDFNFSGKKIFIYQPIFGNDTVEMYQTITNVNTNFTKQFINHPVLENCGNSFDQFLQNFLYQKILKNFDIQNFSLSGSGSCFFSFESFELPECQKTETKFL